MSKDKTSIKGINLLIGLMLFSSIGTAVMYFRVLVLGKHSATLDLIKTRSYAIADFPFTIIPLLIAAYGLYRRKFWGWVLMLMISGVYLHSMVVLIADDLQETITPVMFYLDFYFFIFGAAATIYLVRNRNYFLPRN